MTQNNNPTDATTPPEEKPSAKATYSSLFYRLLDPTFLLDWDTLKIIEINEITEMLLGKPSDEILGTLLTDWTDAQYKNDCEKALRISKRRYYPFQFDIKLKLGKGEFIDTKAGACALSLKDNTQVVQVIAKDVSKQLAAERAAKAYLEELQNLNQKLTALSTTDELTGLTNIRQFKNMLQLEHARSERQKGFYSLVFIDIDHFKKYNDQNGHPAGDQLLKVFSKTLRECVRTTDTAARYGGEEFIILCPDSTPEQAYLLATRFQAKVLETNFEYGYKQPLGFISASMGIAGYPGHGKTVEEVLDLADQALYASKHAGRNRTTIANLQALGDKKYA